MKFEYHYPHSFEEISKLKKEGGVLFSGGTDLFVKIRSGVLKPKMIVDTKGISTPKIEYNGKLRVYMNTTYTELLESEYTKNHVLLRKIMEQVGSPQIRNRGTPIGNIGNASPAGDFLLATYIYNGEVCIAPKMRKVPVSELVTGPGQLKLNEEEFIYYVELDKEEGYNFHFYEKVGRRNALIIAIASIAVLAKVENGVLEDVRVAYGSLAPTIVRAKDIEDEMKGEKITEKFVKHFAEKYQQMVRPISDVRASAEYRKELAKNLFIKAFSRFLV